MAFPAVLWLAVCASLIGAFEYGYAMGVMNTVLDYVSHDLNFDSQVGGAVVVSVLLLGAAVGALGAGMFADAVGTKRAQVINVLFLMVGGALSALTTQAHFCWEGVGSVSGCVPTLLFLGRILTGFGVGCASLYTPRYLAEIAPVNFRGAMGGWYQVLINLGILTGYLIAIPYGFKFDAFIINGVKIAWWRVMLALAIVPAIAQLAMFTFCPESPVWLEWKGRKQEAATVRLALWGEHDSCLQEPLMGAIEAHHHRHGHSHGHSHSLSPHHAHHYNRGHPSHSRSHSYQEPAASGISTAAVFDNSVTIDVTCPSRRSMDNGDILLEALLPKEHIEEKQGTVEGWGALLQKKYRWMVVLALGIPMLQQLSGVNTVVLYSSKLFSKAGVSNPLAGTICTGAVNLVFTAISSPYVDHYGRRPLLLTSFIGMAICLAGLAGSVLGSAAWLGTMSLICILAFMMFFAGGAGPIPWIYLAEILPESIKGRLAALATALAGLINLLISITFPMMLEALGVSASYFIYSGLNVFGVVFIYFLMVETKRLSMDEIVRKLVLPE